MGKSRSHTTKQRKRPKPSTKPRRLPTHRPGRRWPEQDRDHTVWPEPREQRER